MKALIGLITILIAAGCSPRAAELQHTFGGAMSRKKWRIQTAGHHCPHCCGGGDGGDCCNGYYCYYCYCNDDVRRC